MKIFVLNGWAASADAWSLCNFMHESSVSLFSYRDQLDGAPERALAHETDVLLVGWSMGASSALRLACAFREKIRGLILLAPTPRMMEDRENNWIGMSERRLRALEAGVKLTHGEGFFGVREGLPNPYQLDSEENLARGIDYLRRTDLREILEATFSRNSRDEKFSRLPVTIFQSLRDGIVRAENTQYLKDKIFPQARVDLIAGSEHALPIMISEKIDAAVRDALR